MCPVEEHKIVRQEITRKIEDIRDRARKRETRMVRSRAYSEDGGVALFTGGNGELSRLFTTLAVSKGRPLVRLRVSARRFGLERLPTSRTCLAVSLGKRKPEARVFTNSPLLAEIRLHNPEE